MWEAEAAEAAAAYPGTYRGESQRGGFTFHVPVRPTPSPEEQAGVFSDLSRDRAVQVGTGGVLTHSNLECDLHRDTHLWDGAILTTRYTYHVQLELPTVPDGPVGPVHPRARIVPPPILQGLRREVSLRTHPRHPHLSFASIQDSWACPLSPHTTTWTWGPGAVVAYLDSVAIWLAKTEMWERRSGIFGSPDGWMGGSASHDPSVALLTAPDHRCTCGSGSMYQSCHLPRDLLRFLNDWNLSFAISR